MVTCLEIALMEILLEVVKIVWKRSCFFTALRSLYCGT